MGAGSLAPLARVTAAGARPPTEEPLAWFAADGAACMGILGPETAVISIQRITGGSEDQTGSAARTGEPSP
jgi:hypothetical protein